MIQNSDSKSGKMENFLCGGYVFNSNFDSGNLAKVELVNLYEGKYRHTINFI